jgi:streptogramin lyase
MRRLEHVLATLLIGLLGGLMLPASASATINEFPIPTAESNASGVIAGPDGALWFTETGYFVYPGPQSPGNKIGRITTSGSFSEFPVPTAISLPSDITTGSDGALWFTESGSAVDFNGQPYLRVPGKIGRITTSGSFTEYPIARCSATVLCDPSQITAGPDGALWFTERDGYIGRITVAGSISEFPTSDVTPEGITTGPDGALWFTEERGNAIGRITTSGSISEFPIPTADSSPEEITTGPDGALWFTEYFGDEIGRITTAGSISEFPTAADSWPQGIAPGPDGALWFTENYANKIGRITTAGSISEFPTPTTNSGPYGITAGPDGALWFTESDANQIGRITPPPPPPGPSGGGNPPPSSPTPPVSQKITSTKAGCVVPKLRGLSVRKAKRKLSRAGCRYRVRGRGRVVSTSPRAGTRTTKAVLVKTKNNRRSTKRRGRKAETAAHGTGSARQRRFRSL